VVGEFRIQDTVEGDDQERVRGLNGTRRNVDLGEIISVRGVSSDTSEDTGETASARPVVSSDELREGDGRRERGKEELRGER